jgi:hypothetical protein
MNPTNRNGYLEALDREWADNEPRVADAVVQVGDATRRGFARSRLTLATATLAAAGAGYHAATDRPQAARVVVRVSETAMGGGAALGRADLRNWLLDGALSSQRLLAVIDEHGLYPGERAWSADAAIQSMREDMTLEVSANWFVVERSVAQQLRSARVAVGYTAADPELAVAVSMSLAQTMIDFELETRRALSRAELAAAERDLTSAQALLDKRESGLANALAARDARRTSRGSRTRAGVEVSRLADQRRKGNARYDELAARRAELALRVQAEEAELAQRYDIAAIERPIASRLSRWQRAAVAGSAGLALALPLCALALGAFDGRIRNRADLEELGLPMLAHVNCSGSAKGPRMGKSIDIAVEAPGRQGDVELASLENSSTLEFSSCATRVQRANRKGASSTDVTRGPETATPPAGMDRPRDRPTSPFVDLEEARG